MDKEYPSVKPLVRLIRLFKPDKAEVRNVYLYALTAGIVSLSLPLGIQAIINLIQGGKVNTAWIVLVVLVVAGVGMNGVLQIFQLKTTEQLQRKVFVRAAFEFAYRIPRIKMEELYKHYAPELMNRFFDVVSVQKGMSKLLIDFSTAALQVFFGILLLSFYHPFFILFGIILVLVVIAILQYTFPKGLETSLNESKQKYKVAHWLEEIARTFPSFKQYINTDLALVRTNKLTDSYLTDRDSHFRVLINQYSILVIFKVIVSLVLLAIGGLLVMEQLMNIGQFVAAEIIILTIISSVEKLIMSLDNIYDIITGLEKIGQVTDLELEENKEQDFKDFEFSEGIEVKFEDVSFRYPNYYKETLVNINLSIASGANFGIIGRNGSGKSTLLQIASGLYQINTGNVLYNGLPKGNIGYNYLRPLIGLHISDDELFEGSIEENITMKRPGIDFKALNETCNALFLTGFIKTLPDGYQSQINPTGNKLPNNITQKLLLARAIISKPKLLILETKIENLDVQEKKHIVDFLVDKEKPWTLLISTSDDYFLNALDMVASMNAGSIEEVAPYKELKNKLELRR